jgi:hypothetical protein
VRYPPCPFRAAPTDAGRRGAVRYGVGKATINFVARKLRAENGGLGVHLSHCTLPLRCLPGHRSVFFLICLEAVATDMAATSTVRAECATEAERRPAAAGEVYALAAGPSLRLRILNLIMFCLSVLV